MYDLSSIPRVSEPLNYDTLINTLLFTARQLFMQADFHLEDPTTFQQVVPLQELGPGSRRTKKTARNGESGKKNLSSPSSSIPTAPPVSSTLLHEKV